jgi:hypothetical protein
MLLNGVRKEAFGAMMKANTTASIPRTTLNNVLIDAKRIVNENTTAGDCMGLVGLKSNYDMFKCPTEHYQKGKDVLTTKEDRELLQSIATSRDEMNNGMNRKEMISLMSKLFSVLSKAAENHFDYLIKSKQFPELKRGGFVVSAQATTTNRTAITTQKLLWTYNTIHLAWAK